MAKVWDAMKRHTAEQAEAAKAESSPPGPTAEPAPAAPAAPAHPGETGAVSAALAAASPPRGETPVLVETAQPATNGADYDQALVAHHDHGGHITEQYRALRTSIMSQYGDGKFCLLVTSAEMNEGKTVTSLNLAVVLAERQECRTLVVDCDLRGHRVADLLGLEERLGVADVLSGRATLRQVARATAYPNLFVVTAGQADPNQVGKLLGRPEFADLVEQMRRQYDYVLLDTPPVNSFSDAGLMGGTVGEALLVVRMHKTHREAVDRAIGLLKAANVRVCGIVLTHLKYRRPKYRYRYYSQKGSGAFRRPDQGAGQAQAASKEA